MSQLKTAHVGTILPHTFQVPTKYPIFIPFKLLMEKLPYSLKPHVKSTFETKNIVPCLPKKNGILPIRMDLKSPDDRIELLSIKNLLTNNQTFEVVVHRFLNRYEPKYPKSSSPNKKKSTRSEKQSVQQLRETMKQSSGNQLRKRSSSKHSPKLIELDETGNRKEVSISKISPTLVSHSVQQISPTKSQPYEVITISGSPVKKNLKVSPTTMSRLTKPKAHRRSSKGSPK